MFFKKKKSGTRVIIARIDGCRKTVERVDVRMHNVPRAGELVTSAMGTHIVVEVRSRELVGLPILLRVRDL